MICKLQVYGEGCRRWPWQQYTTHQRPLIGWWTMAQCDTTHHRPLIGRWTTAQHYTANEWWRRARDHLSVEGGERETASANCVGRCRVRARLQQRLRRVAAALKT